MEQISLFSLLPKAAKSLALFPNSFMYRGLCIIVVRKPYRRAMHLSVEMRKGVQISCARRTTLKEIKSFLADHWEWIQKELLEQQKIKRKHPVKKFRTGESFLFQGKKLKLQYKHLPAGKSGPFIEKGFYIKGRSLIYCWSRLEDLGKDFLRQELKSFFEKTGKQLLQEAIAVFSSRMRLVPKAVRIGSQRSLWGSCSSEGNISLNWRLVVAPPEVMNYVVIHELAHLKYLDHSAAFWSLVARFCPDYKKYETWLGHNTYTPDFLLSFSKEQEKCFT